jgi:hypothetical protein
MRAVLFELRDLGHYEVKGLADPVNARAVEGLSAAESRSDAVRAVRKPGFVARENGKIDLVLHKALRVLGHSEFFEPVRNLLHRGHRRFA